MVIVNNSALTILPVNWEGNHIGEFGVIYWPRSVELPPQKGISKSDGIFAKVVSKSAK